MHSLIFDPNNWLFWPIIIVGAAIIVTVAWLVDKYK